MQGVLEFVKLLIEQGARVNECNDTQKETPLHAACREARPEIVKILLEHGADSSEKDESGRQPLHVAAFVEKHKYKNEHLQCLKTLLDSGACVNTQDRSGSTALQLALIRENTSAAEILISYGANPDINPFSGESVSTELLRFSENTNEDNIEIQLFEYMNNKDLEEFRRLLKDGVQNGLKIGKNDHGPYHLLQHACEKEGFEGFISILLEDSNVDPNRNYPGINSDRKPLLVAAKQGNHNAIRILMNHEKTDHTVVDEGGENALHKVARMENGTREDMNYFQSMEILVDTMKSQGSATDPLLNVRIDINAVDKSGNTALHYAARNLDKGVKEAEKIVFALLKSGAYAGIQNKRGEPSISRVTVELLEEYLDECIGTNDEPSCAENYALTFNYSMLIPPSNGTNKKEVSQIIMETEPLIYLCNNDDHQCLLKHPVISSFLYLKWHRIRRIFVANLIFYVLFVASITTYILGVYGSDPPDNSEEDSTSMQWTNVFSVFSVILLLGLALRELFQCVMSPVMYIKSLENLLEIAVIVFTVAMLFTNLDHETKQHMAAVVILLVWTELVLLIGRHPKLSTYITMFTVISRNFLKFLLWYALFIIAFALSFFILFRQGKKSDKGASDQPGDGEENVFANPGGAIIKTVVMLTGEFDFSDLPLDTFKITSHLVFLLFLFLISVVLLNLLNGLAVSDTQEVKDKAELVGYKSRVMLVSLVESMLFGRKLQFLDKLKGCVLSNESTSAVRMAKRSNFCTNIMIFPEMPKISVMVNDGGRISPRCCNPRNTHSCSMDPRVIKAARSIVTNKTKHSKIDKIDERLQVMEEYLKKIQSSITGKI